ncbi:hypothetical protein [Parachitinimonas caeni]|uniref:Lipoprotein n=1 Tax=Parachitinimonas caeni TaxID=3031301 RepID=A0ABT7DUC4_9NEIS|nr:hypothetical protein [Parachitinimonas caeni]MDK2123666.1 hypothetical protein [Parachitinimonas caeni]
MGWRELACLVVTLALTSCATAPPPAPPPVKVEPPPPVVPKEIHDSDYLAAEALEAKWSSQGIKPQMMVKETVESSGDRLIVLKMLTVPIGDNYGALWSLVDDVAILAAKAKRPATLSVRVKNRQQQQAFAGRIKAAAVASGGKNSVVLDYRISVANPIQLTVQFQP